MGLEKTIPHVGIEREGCRVEVEGLEAWSLEIGLVQRSTCKSFMVHLQGTKHTVLGYSDLAGWRASLKCKR
jgi:hypothetical protein